MGESDKFIDILTKEYGILEASVKGVKKLNSQNSAATQLFAYSRFCLQKRGERYYLNSSEVITTFYNIRLDVQKFALAAYFSEVLLYAVQTEQAAEETLRLLLNTLHFLAQGKRSLCLLKSIFELRLLSDIGMMPDLVGCKSCAAYDGEMVLVINEGVIFCGKCYKKERGDGVLLSAAMLYALRFIALSELEKLWSFKLSAASEGALCHITESYLLTHMNRGFKTLDFYHDMEIL